MFQFELQIELLTSNTSEFMENFLTECWIPESVTSTKSQLGYKFRKKTSKSNQNAVEDCTFNNVININEIPLVERN